MFRGALAFSLVSTAAFAVWAFGAGWFAGRGGEAGMYAACCAAFLLFSGLLLRPALRWGGWARFYAEFVPAFLSYAVAWCAVYFLAGDGAGEWIASLAGCAAFAAVLAAMRRGWRVYLISVTVLFAGHSAGYFAGRHVCYTSLHSTASELLWGTLYGLGFGAGTGYVISRMPRS